MSISFDLSPTHMVWVYIFRQENYKYQLIIFYYQLIDKWHWMDYDINLFYKYHFKAIFLYFFFALHFAFLLHSYIYFKFLWTELSSVIFRLYFNSVDRLKLATKILTIWTQDQLWIMKILRADSLRTARYHLKLRQSSFLFAHILILPLYTLYFYDNCDVWYCSFTIF